MDFKRTPKVQGHDSIEINAPAAIVWPLIVDSKQMENWGPPVQKVDVRLLDGQNVESVGSYRKVYAKFSEKRTGWYEEVRTDQQNGKSVTFLIINDSFGMAKLLEDVGARMAVEPINATTCRFDFTFYHRPKNLMGRIMNPLVKADQKKNRKKALLSIKSFVETGKSIKN